MHVFTRPEIEDGIPLSAEALTAKSRTLEMFGKAGDWSSREHCVTAIMDSEIKYQLAVKITRQPGLNMFRPLQRYEVLGIMAAEDDEAAQLGGRGIGEWAPDNQDKDFIAEWRRVYDFLPETDPPESAEEDV